MTSFDLVYISRPSGDVPKKALRDAALAAGLEPRSNWRAPAHREILKALKSRIEGLGISVVRELNSDERQGKKGVYQTRKSWQLRGPLGGNLILTWDAEACQFYHREGLSAEWSELLRRKDTIVEDAWASSVIRNAHVAWQWKASFVESFPCAPFAIDESGVYHLLVESDSEAARQAESFILALGWDYVIVNQLVGNEQGADYVGNLIDTSRGLAQKKFPTPGAVAASDRAHVQLLELLP